MCYNVLTRGSILAGWRRKCTQGFFVLCFPESSREDISTKGCLVANLYDHSDTGNAELFNELFGNDIRYDQNLDRWLIWKESLHRWEELSEAEQTQFAIKTANKRFAHAQSFEDQDAIRREANFAVRSRNANSLNNMLSLAKHLPPIHNSSIKWDSNRDLLVTKNGVVDLRTGILREGRRSDFITHGIDIEYSLEAKAPLWEKFLREVTLDRPELIFFIQRAIGYTLTGHIKEQVFFLLHGTGANGKGVLANIIRKLLTDFSKLIRFAAFEENTTSDAKRDLAELPGIRAVFASEGTEHKSFDTGTIKQITGGEPITTSRKYGHPFTYDPQFKIWLNTNHLPRVIDDSFGFWRRILVIPFEAEFYGAARDNNLEDKLMVELPGILTWAVQGASSWHANGLNIPNLVLLKTANYKTKTDTVARFFVEMCISEPNSEILASELYQAYLLWCLDKEEEPVSNTAFGRNVGEKITKKRNMVGIFYLGIKLRDL